MWQNKIICITGAGSGIGRALARRMAELGGRLVLTDVNHEALQETVNSLGSAVLHWQRADVSDKQDWQNLAVAIGKVSAHIDVLVNNAGTSAYDFFPDMPEDMFDRVMDINLNGVIYGCRYLMPLLEKSSRGMIVNVASIFGLISVPMLTPYHASKFAVRGFTEALKQDMIYSGRKIDVLCVMPGGIKTNIVNYGQTQTSDKAKVAAHFNRVARTSPEQAAKVIETGMRKRKARILIGPDAHFVNVLYKLMPTYYYKVFNRLYGVNEIL